MGSSPNAVSATLWAGSVERWPASHHRAASGAMSRATSAAAREKTPSSTTGVERTAACTRNPAVAAAHALPRAVSRSNGSATRPSTRCSARSTTATLWACPVSSTPVPVPVTRCAGRPRDAPTSAAATVLLPMPMSPGISRSAPASTSSSATARPTEKACSASPGVRASSTSIAPEPRRTLRATTSRATSSSSASTAMSSTRTRAPTSRARTVTPLVPAWNTRTIAAVSSLGYADTPGAPGGAADTPWSPANTATRTSSSGRGGTVPWAPHSHAASSSSLPSEPTGLTSSSSRRRA